MGIIQLNSNLVRELPPGALSLLETADDIVQRGSNPEVLLLETKLLATLEVIVGVQHGADGLSALLLCHGALVVAVVELLEVELAARGLAGPKSKVVRGRGVVSGDRNIVGNSLNDLAAFPDGDSLALRVGGLSDATEELDLMDWCNGLA